MTYLKTAQNRAFSIVECIDGEQGEEFCKGLVDCAVDIEFRVGRRGEYRSAYILFRVAAPTVYIDTGRKTVVAIGGADRLELNYENETLDKIVSRVWEHHAKARSYA